MKLPRLRPGDAGLDLALCFSRRIKRKLAFHPSLFQRRSFARTPRLEPLSNPVGKRPAFSAFDAFQRVRYADKFNFKLRGRGMHHGIDMSAGVDEREMRRDVRITPNEAARAKNRDR